MARIGIDATSVEIAGKGLARYQKNIVWALAGLQTGHEYFVFHKSEGSAEFVNLDLPNCHLIKVFFLNSFCWDQVQLPWLAKHYRLDLIHTACDKLPFFCKTPFVMYLFEIPTHRMALSQKSSRRRIWYQRFSEAYRHFFFPYGVRKASMILASSEFTRQDLINFFHVAEEKIKVVYSACDENFKPPANEENRLAIRNQISGGCEYLLHFSTGDPRDNTTVVLKAFGKARKYLQKDLKLLVCGIPPGKRDWVDAIALEEALNGSVIWHEFSSGETLRRIYQGASAYLDPSLFEGFGFQLLEAMACGVPVIASNVTAIPEIVGDAGLLINPNDGDALAEAIRKVSTDTCLRNDLREKGLGRAASFNWNKTARQVLECFQMVLEGLQ